MAGNNFLNIPIEECNTAYKKILSNSEATWENADVLANASKYGNAISIHIISIEELIKSLIVFFDGQGFNLRKISGIQIFFKDHKIRHLISYVLFAMGILGDDMIAFLKKCKDNPQKLIALHKEWVNDPGAMERYKFYILRKFILFREEFEWFARMEFMRQEGFYSDFSGDIKSPLQITKADYDEVIKRMQKVRIAAMWLITSFQNADQSTLDHIQKLKEDFSKKETIEKISAALLNIRKTKGGAFDHVKNHLETNF
jgi:AbiV family abortive infection protein